MSRPQSPSDQPGLPAIRLEELAFDNRFVRELPGDNGPERQRREVRGACWSRAAPLAFPAPRLLAHSREVCRLLDMADDPEDPELFAAIFSGNRLLPGMQPFAMCYGGHQFGTWAGQLGDGRAINLGEVRNRRGEHWTLQLKGAGPTPYSRNGDGLAVLRSSIREFLCSEAMHHLGIPTTRALSLVLTGEQVIRDMFYDGRPQAEPGAVVCRVARSFVRFGNFQILAAQRDEPLLRQLVRFVMRNDFGLPGDGGTEELLAWFAEVCRRTRSMILGWMRTGFVHGVMNTDNMSVLGDTIDYGPYGWLEGYDPRWTPNTTDAQGRRYCFGAQPQIALWNLVQFANALVPLVGDPEPFEQILRAWAPDFQRDWLAMMAARLGLTGFRGDEDAALFDRLLELFEAAETDWTIFFRELATLPSTGQQTAEPDRPGAGSPDPDSLLLQPVVTALYDPACLTESLRGQWLAWLRDWQGRLREDGLPDPLRRSRMNALNPRYVLRNWLAQEAIDAATGGDCSRIHELLDVLRHPYDDQPGRDHFAGKRPEWARHRPGCSMLSCSS